MNSAQHTGSKLRLVAKVHSVAPVRVAIPLNCRNNSWSTCCRRWAAYVFDVWRCEKRHVEIVVKACVRLFQRPSAMAKRVNAFAMSEWRCRRLRAPIEAVFSTGNGGGYYEQQQVTNTDCAVGSRSSPDRNGMHFTFKVGSVRTSRTRQQAVPAAEFYTI